MHRIRGILLALLCITVAYPSYAFTNLDAVRQFTESHPEFPKEDSLSWEYTDYSSFYTQQKPPFIQRIRRFLGFSNTNDTITQIELAADTRLDHYKGPQRDETTIVRIDAANEPTLYVWGDLHGSLHSLYRALAYLEKEQIIENTLAIKKQNTFLVFNGNAINGSPYNLEILTLILNLIEKNPDHVIYLQGKEEHEDYWKNGGLRVQIRKMIPRNIGNQKILEEKMSALFKTLPVSLYVSNIKEPTIALRISYFDRQTTGWINALLFGTFFSQKQQTPLLWYDINAKEKSTSEPFITAIIRGQDWKKEQRVKNGLGLLDQDKGSTAWAVLSCPTAAYQKFYDFYYDAFAKVEINQAVNHSTITLCNRAIKGEGSFICQETRSLASGRPVAQRGLITSDEDIMLGSAMSLIQGVPVMGSRTQNGMLVRVAQENERGGINGHLIRIMVENDDYNPSKTRALIHRFIDQKIDSIVLPIGSPTLSSYIDLIKKNEILTLFPITGAPAFRDPSLSNIINFRSGYADEVKALLEHAYVEWNARKFVLFYQDDSYGQGPLATAHKILGDKKCTLIDIPYSRGTINLKTHAQKIQDAQPDVIAFFATAQTAIELIRQLGINSIVNKKLICISFCAEESFRAFIEQHNIPVLIGAVVPNPFLSKIPIVREYRDAMDTAGYLYDVFSLEAYIATSILIEALKKIEQPFTKEKIKNALTSLKKTSISGLHIDYDPTNLTLHHVVYLETGDNNKWIRKPNERIEKSRAPQEKAKEKVVPPSTPPTQPIAPGT